MSGKYLYVTVEGLGIWIYEHRANMEKKIGRKLRPGENVHHINGIKTDNRPENLELWVTAQPAGQRASDLLVWAREVLEIYEPLADVL